jgi:hypothetical protein
VTYEGIGKVNASPPRHIREFEFYDPRALVDYLAMPKRVQNIEAMLEKALNGESVSDGRYREMKPGNLN